MSELPSFEEVNAHFEGVKEEAKKSLPSKGFKVDNIAEPQFGMQLGPGFISTHDPSNCSGRYCVIHNPSAHHMRSWPTNWRADRQLMERTCTHGIGHPDPDDLAFQITQGRGWQANHGCDGCCLAPRKF